MERIHIFRWDFGSFMQEVEQKINEGYKICYNKGYPVADIRGFETWVYKEEAKEASFVPDEVVEPEQPASIPVKESPQKPVVKKGPKKNVR